MDYSPGDFIYHKDRGVGRVTRVIEGTETELEVEYFNQPAAVYTAELVNQSTTRLSPSGFHALAYLDRQRALDLLRDDPVEVICLTMEDHTGYKAQTSQLKDYLAEYIPEWDKWWEKTQTLLKESQRIDSSSSKLRIYGLHQGLNSRAGELYASFTRFRTFQPQKIVYEQARSALLEVIEGGNLTNEQLKDLHDYFHQIITSNRTPPGLRLDALFRLESGKYLTDNQFQNDLSNILKEPIKLYLLEPFSQNRLSELLITAKQKNTHIDLLAGGICGTVTVANRIVDWAVKRGQPGDISRIIKAAFSEYLPGELPSDEYPSLKRRIIHSRKLLRCLTQDDLTSSGILEAFHQLVASLSNLQVTDIQFFLPDLVLLTADLGQRIASASTPEYSKVLSCLVNPAYPIQFILGMLEMVDKQKDMTELGKTIEKAFWDSADQRQDDFIKPFIAQRNPDPLIQAGRLVEIVRQYPQKTFGKQAARILCEMARGVEPEMLIQLMPYLDQLYWLDTGKEWSGMLEPIREKAYFILVSDAGGNFLKSRLLPVRGDQALTAAVSRYVEDQLQQMKTVIQDHQERTSELQTTIHSLHKLLEEKEKILSELKGSFGGDTTKAKYEERVRLLKEIGASVAEFERIVAVPGRSTPELEALISRLSNLLQLNGVIALGAPGERISYDIGYCRLTGGTGAKAGDTVFVVERGYRIQDPKGTWRVLKYAQVRNIDQP